MMKQYSSYKDSGIDWIGQIPSHWILMKFGYLFHEKSSTNNLSLRTGSISFGNVVYKDDESIPLERKETYQELLKGEFLVNPLNLNYDLKSLRIGLSDIDVVVSPGYIVLQLRGGNNKYFNYLLRTFDTQHMKSLGNGIRQTISFKHLSTEYIPLPPLSEQEHIVSYLDDKTTKIDELIQKKLRKIDLLKEYRTSLINTVVTKGLNPDVPMKDSGIDWIGQIPSHWKTLRLSNIFNVTSIKNHPEEPNLSVYRDYGVIPRDSRDDNHNVVSEDTSQYKLVEVGDFVMNKMKCWMGSIGLSKYRGIVSPSYTVLKVKHREVYSDYFHLLLRSSVYIPEYKRLSYGVRVGQWDLRFEDFKDIPGLLPPLSEQEHIVSYLDEKTSQIDKTIDIEKKKIELLKEYRQSLISNVVTGKIKVIE
jgi:type I restriction enzyme, S subunit